MTQPAPLNKSQFMAEMYWRGILQMFGRNLSPQLQAFGHLDWGDAQARLVQNGDTFNFIWMDGQELYIEHRGRGLNIPNSGWFRLDDSTALKAACRELGVEIVEDIK